MGYYAHLYYAMQDRQTVLRNATQGRKKVMTVGHSLGGGLAFLAAR